MKPHLSQLRRLPLPALAVAALVVLACLGSARESPVCRERATNAGVSAPLAVDAPAWQAPANPQSVNVSRPNLQLPRAPRHRGERPASGADEVEAISDAHVLALLGNDTHRPFVAPTVFACPLAGHPLSLLRPPSLVAG